MATIAVIIVSWNCREALRKCLLALKEHGPENVDIIVVDNASSDSTPDMVQREFPKVLLLPQRENLGFARANNLAMKETGADYLFLLNPDTQIKSGAIGILNSFLDSTPQAGIAAPMLLDDQGLPIASFFRFPNLLNYWTEHSFLITIKERMRKSRSCKKTGAGQSEPRVREIDWATGAAFMVRRSALGGDPLFDEGFFLYSEDADLCKRLSAKGWKRFYVPSAHVAHSHRGSSRQALARTIVHLFQSQDLYFAKHKTPIGRFFLRSFILLDMIIRLLLLKIFPQKKAFRMENEERRKGYRDVIRSLNPFRFTNPK